MMTKVILCLIAAGFIFFLAACSTSGNLGILMKSTADPASILRSGQDFEEIGMPALSFGDYSVGSL